MKKNKIFPDLKQIPDAIQYDFITSSRNCGRTQKIKMQAKKQDCISISKKNGKWKYVNNKV